MDNIITWASITLKKQDYIIIKEPIHILSTPWSIVIKFITDKGDIYLKKVIKSLLIEADVIQMIGESVPTIIATNRDLQCFMMIDGGVTLRSLFKQKFDIELYSKAINQYTKIQIDSIQKINDFIHIGLPDWRLNNFANIYNQLMNKDDLLNEIGITHEEKIILRSVSNKIASICNQLSTFQIHNTLDQGDFHDNNILINPKNQKITIIDLGEVFISHPFFSLHHCLFMAQYCGFCSENDDNYFKLRDAYFENFKMFESENNLLKIFELTKILHPLYYVFRIDYLMTLCQHESFRSDFVNSHGKVQILSAEKHNIPGILRSYIK